MSATITADGQAQIPLTCASPNKRPERSDQMCREASAQLVASMVKRKLIEAEDAEESISDILDATRYEEHDGYKIAKQLEDRHGWDCDMQIAEALEGFSANLDRIYGAAEKQWAAENPCEPPLVDGATVMWRGKPAIIVGVYDHRPHCYRVHQGQMKHNSSFIVPFEDVSESLESGASI